jgi:hypothetical protein
MSRVRVSYVLAFFGILITTGGCSSSATAPEAASVEASTNRASNPTERDTQPTSTDEGDVTVQSGFISGGSRQ